MALQLPSIQPNRGGVITARGLYFGYYMALGSFLPYINLYYGQKGLSGMQIGLLSALGVLTTSATSIAWGGIADRLHLHRRMLSLDLLIAPVCVFLISRANSFAALIPVVVAYALAIAPIIPLLDSGALDVSQRHGRSYGELRAAGSLGWIVSVTLVGFLMQRFGSIWLFYTYIAFMALTAALSLFQPDRNQTLQAPWSTNLRALISDSSILFFLGSAFLVAAASGAVQNFFSLYMNGIGAGQGLIGIGYAVAALSEIPVMVYSGNLMRRFGAAGLLKIAFFIYAMRWLLCSFIQDPVWAVVTQLLQGLSFAAFLTAGVAYLNQRTPAGFATTSQAIFNVVCYGLAAVVGSLAGGYLYDNGGMTVLFRVFSLVTVAGLALFWVGSARPWRRAYGTSV